MVRRTCRRYILSVNRQTRIRIVARHVALKPHELIGFGGWFDHRVHYGKHLRRCGIKMPRKLKLRNLYSMNVFLDADFWLAKLPMLLALA